MKEEIFRKKSLDKIKSPENLDDYIKVSNPGVWLLLVSVIVLLAGAFVWGIFGHVDSTAATAVRVENGSAVCYVSQEDIESVRVGLTVNFANCEAVVTEIGDKGENGYECALSADSAVADGFYEGTLIIKSYKPISFILN